MARRKNRTNDTSGVHHSETHDFLSKKPPAYKQVIASLEKSKETDSNGEVQLHNKELQDEITKWRKEHVK